MAHNNWIYMDINVDARKGERLPRTRSIGFRMLKNPLYRLGRWA